MRCGCVERESLAAPIIECKLQRKCCNVKNIYFNFISYILMTSAASQSALLLALCVWSVLNSWNLFCFLAKYDHNHSAAYISQEPNVNQSQSNTNTVA